MPKPVTPKKRTDEVEDILRASVEERQRRGRLDVAEVMKVTHGPSLQKPQALGHVQLWHILHEGQAGISVLPVVEH